jgi:hypothetical protein
MGAKSAPIETESQPTAQSEQSSESSPEDTAIGDEPVESSAAPDEVAASDESDPAELTSETADTQQPNKKPPSRAQVRIEDLIASNRALKTSLEYLQTEVLTKLQPQAQQPTAQTPAALAAEDAPTLESCGFDTDKWTKAVNAWTNKRIEQGISKAVQTVQQNQTEATRRAAFESRMAAVSAVTPDFQVILGNPALPQLHKDAASLVVDSELGPQILYHLGKNPEEAARIARKTPVQQAAAIGRLEAELSKPVVKSSQKTPTNITKAPAPPTPTKGGGASHTDMTKAPIADFVAHERKLMAEKRRIGR